MKNNSSRKNIIWSYIGVFFDFGINLFLLPLILAYLPHKELGLWYSFASVSTLIKLVNFGFTPCITRYIGFAWGGASEILADGLSVKGDCHDTNYELLSKVINIAKKIFVFLALIVAVLLVGPGSFYIISIREDIAISYVLVSWALYAIAVAIDMLFGYWDSVLRGIGAVADSQKSNMITKCIQLIASATGLILGYGLVAVAASYLISNLIKRFIVIRFCKKRISHCSDVLHSKCNDKDLRKNMVSNAFRFGVSTLSAQLIAQVFQMVCSSVYGLDIAAKYGLSIQILSFVVTISTALFNAVVPEITINKTKGLIEEEKKLLSTGMFAQWLLMPFGSICAIYIGPFLLKILSKDNNLLSKPELFLILAIYLVEYNRWAFCTYISTGNELPYTKAVTIASIVTSLAVIVEAAVFNLPLIVLLITRIAVEMSYNGWYWMKKVLKRLKLKFKDIIVLGACGTKDLVLSVLKRN